MIRPCLRSALIAASVPVLCLAQAPPHLAVDEAIHEFGRIRMGERPAHRFRITNDGGAELKILRLVSSCGCTSTVAGKDTLAPGEGTDLETVFNSEGFQGPVTKTIQVLTNDPASPSLTLTLKAEVQADVTPSTQEIHFGDLGPRDRRKASVKLTSETGQPILVTGADLSEAPWLGVATRTVGKDVFVDFLLLAKNLSPKEVSGIDTVTLHLANPRLSEVRLHVRWDRRVPVLADPGRVSLDEPAGADIACSVYVSSRDGKPFRILGARSTTPQIEAVDLPRAAAARHRVYFKVSGTIPAGTHDERVVLTLDAPGQQELPIRFSLFLR